MESIIAFVQSLNSGYCDGSGYGYGNGDGYGSGYGSGYCDGSGNGYGNGDGSGNGSGYGDGSGNGSGYCDGYGIKSFCGRAVHRIDGINTALTHAHGNIARGYTINADMTTNPCYVAKNGNTFAHGSTIADARDALQEKIIDQMDGDDKIRAFQNEFAPGRMYPVAKFYDWHHNLTGSCEMGRKQFAREHGIDLEHGQMTVNEFVRLTRNAYGGSIIKKIEAVIGGNRNG